MVNKYEIFEDYFEIIVINKKNIEFRVKVSMCDLEKFISHQGSWIVAWKPKMKKYYATTTVYLGKRDDGIGYKNTSIELHKFIMNPKKGYVVDHINHDTLDNRRCNLRVIKQNNNCKNRKGRNSNNKSGYRNVCWDKKSEQWMVQLQVEGKNKVLGRFDDVDEAGAFAKEMREKYYGEFAGKG